MSNIVESANSILDEVVSEVHEAALEAHSVPIPRLYEETSTMNYFIYFFILLAIFSVFKALYSVYMKKRHGKSYSASKSKEEVINSSPIMETHNHYLMGNTNGVYISDDKF